METLFASAKTGDRDSFDELVEQFRPRLRSFAVSRMSADLRKHVEVEDILQEVFLKAIHSIGSFQWKGDKAFFSWLCGVANHIILSHSRRYLRLQPEDSISPIDVGETSPSKQLRRNERFDRLDECLESLTDDQKAVIQLVRLEGLSIREAAAKLNRTENATIQLLWRATQQLKHLFGDTASLHLPPDRNLSRKDDSL